MLGHLVPQGTGSFDLLLDHRMLADAHTMVQLLPPPIQHIHEAVAPSGMGGYVDAIASPHRDALDFPSFDRPTVWSPAPVSPGQFL